MALLVAWRRRGGEGARVAPVEVEVKNVRHAKHGGKVVRRCIRARRGCDGTEGRVIHHRWHAESRSVERLSRHLVFLGRRRRFFRLGGRPIPLPAATIYLVTLLVNEQRTARRISVAAGVSDVTIKHSYKELLKVLDQVLTPDILAKDRRIDLSRIEAK